MISILVLVACVGFSVFATSDSPIVFDKATLSKSCSHLCKHVAACQRSGKGSHCKLGNPGSADGTCHGLFQIAGLPEAESFVFHTERAGDAQKFPVGCVAAANFFVLAPHLIQSSKVLSSSRSAAIPTRLLNQVRQAIGNAATTGTASLTSGPGDIPMQITLNINVHFDAPKTDEVLVNTSNVLDASGVESSEHLIPEDGIHPSAFIDSTIDVAPFMKEFGVHSEVHDEFYVPPPFVENDESFIERDAKIDFDDDIAITPLRGISKIQYRNLRTISVVTSAVLLGIGIVAQSPDLIKDVSGQFWDMLVRNVRVTS